MLNIRPIDCRGYLQTTWFVLAVCLLALFFANVAYAGKPNIVFIMADDLGWSDTSNSLTNLGNPSDYYETPCLDRLAKEGMAFTNAYTSGANCAPTRAALLTGQYAQRPTNNVYQVGNLNRGGDDTMLVCPKQGLANGDDAIPPAAFTYAEHLQQNGGYATAHIGKFHVTSDGASDTEAIQTKHGFSENWGGNHHGNARHYHAKDGTFLDHVGPELDRFAANYDAEFIDKKIKPYSVGIKGKYLQKLIGTPKHVSDALTDAAIDFMERKKAKPFMIQFHPYAVHTPINEREARKDLLRKYKKKPQGIADSHASFGALIEGMDQSVARIVDYLKRTEDPGDSSKTLANNTILIFYSDNGGRLNQSNNGPLRGQKGELHEGGIRVPMIVWSANPRLVQGGKINKTPVATIDFYRTFGALAGIVDPESTTLDGHDLSGLFANVKAKLDRNALFWHLPAYLIDKKQNKHRRIQKPESVVRSGKWKLRYFYETQSFELYDLKSDLSESRDLVSQHPKIVEVLGEKLLHHLDSTQAPLPKLREGKLSLTFSGKAYFGGKIHKIDGNLTVEAGEEVPYLLPLVAPL